MRGFLDTFVNTCKELYQPFQNISIDARMVKSKGRSGIKQYIKNKPTKWGIKLWVLADSLNGYTCDFEVYTGKNTAYPLSEKGLGYDVVMRLTEALLNQGYHLFFDNFYTSRTLVNDLFLSGTLSCGTVGKHRKDFPSPCKEERNGPRKPKEVIWYGTELALPSPAMEGQ